MKREVVVQGINFNEVGIDLAFMVIPDDVRDGGKVVISRQIALADTTTGVLGQHVVDIREAVEALAQLVLEQAYLLPEYEAPVEPEVAFGLPDVEDPDEDKGMGDG